MTKFSFFNYLRIKNHLKPLFSMDGMESCNQQA